VSKTQDPSVSVSGTNPNYTIDFGIPYYEFQLGSVSTANDSTTATVRLSKYNTDKTKNLYYLDLHLQKGDKGDKGDALKYSDLTTANKQDLVSVLMPMAKTNSTTRNTVGYIPSLAVYNLSTTYNFTPSTTTNLQWGVKKTLEGSQGNITVDSNNTIFTLATGHVYFVGVYYQINSSVYKGLQSKQTATSAINYYHSNSSSYTKQIGKVSSLTLASGGGYVYYMAEGIISTCGPTDDAKMYVSLSSEILTSSGQSSYINFDSGTLIIQEIY
jgi:hypothetical protein